MEHGNTPLFYSFSKFEWTEINIVAILSWVCKSDKKILHMKLLYAVYVNKEHVKRFRLLE